MNPTTFAGPPPSVAAIYQKEEEEWNTIISKIVVLDDREKSGALEMGDLFVYIEDRFGKAKLKDAAEKTGVEYGTIRQRAWVSRKVSKSSPLRDSHLTYTHLRALAALPPDQMEEWADKALENAWGSKRLKDELAASGIGLEKAPAAPGVCIECEQALPMEGEGVDKIIRWSQGGKHGACCSPACAIFYFNLQLTPTSQAYNLPEEDFFEIPTMGGIVQASYQKKY